MCDEVAALDRIAKRMTGEACAYFDADRRMTRAEYRESIGADRVHFFEMMVQQERACWIDGQQARGRLIWSKRSPREGEDAAYRKHWARELAMSNMVCQSLNALGDLLGGCE